MISSQIIENAIYDLCVEANTVLGEEVFTKILEAYNSEENSDSKQALQLILQNAQMAYEKKMPLCQDTGQVLVFVKLGEQCQVENLESSINNAVAKAYEENFYRKSVVKNALFDRTNTKTNTPCVIYTELTEGNELEFNLLIKGAGSENVSEISMLSPTSTEAEITDFVVSVVQKAGAKGCPPYFVGVGIGGTMEYAGVLSKKALLLVDTPHPQPLSRKGRGEKPEQHKIFAEKIKAAINELNIGAAGRGGLSTALDVKILIDFTHIACMPVAVTINCHSLRHAKCVLDGTEKAKNKQEPQNRLPLTVYRSPFQPTDFIQVNSSDIKKLKSFKRGQKVLLSGEIYTARDMAHKRLIELIEKGEKLPFDFKDKIIFYAGPCPCAEDCVVGSIGPTTASRMDKFAPILYEKGILATIGKGERSKEVEKTAKQLGGLYFSVIGGISCYLSEKFIGKELVAFEDLGTEAVYRFEVKDLPLRLEF
ncbi:MAG: fumarate hydratase [bacterium]